MTGTTAVEVVYAERGHCISIEVFAAVGETVAEIIHRCGILNQCSVDFDPFQGEGAIGIFGELVGSDLVPKDGDRIEIYRPLKQHPMEARRQRVVKR